MDDFWTTNGGHSECPSPNDGRDQIEIFAVDQHTKRECEVYGVKYDPTAQYGLYLVGCGEYVLDSLHPDLETAQDAGKRVWGVLASEHKSRSAR